METTIQKNIRNSELSIPKEKRAFLTYSASGLAPCVIEEQEDSVNFIFDIKGTTPAETILKKTRLEQLRFLINCAKLKHLYQEYDFILSLDNLRIDINMMPLLLIRDAKSSNNLDFTQCYKALIGSVLLSKYKYENYIDGGQDLYKKNKFLHELANFEDIDDIQNRLTEEYNIFLQETATTQKMVSKNSVLISRIAIPVLAIAFVITLFFGGRMMLIEIPFNNSVISASNAYINGDHLTVQRELRPYSIDRLSTETKYFLSRSYVSTEALTHVQITNILMGLTRLTDPIIFDYWILLGRLHFSEAVDIAQRLGDDELLLFAYLKQEVYVRSDISISGEDRVALLSYLESNIDRLNRARDEVVGE